MEAGPNPTSFPKWVKEPNNLYIASQAKKYLHNAKENSKWNHGKLSWRLYQGEITPEEFLGQYEEYVRKDLWNDLGELANKTMGCWCEDQTNCHGKVLQKLYKEKMAKEFFNM